MPHLKIDEQPRCYEMNRAGDSLVLIPGKRPPRLFRRKQLVPSSEKSSIVTLDNRGIDNRSRVDSLFTIDNMADDVAATLHRIQMPTLVYMERKLLLYPMPMSGICRSYQGRPPERL